MVILPSLLHELLEALEKRDACDPDVPGWEAEAEVRRLERLLLRDLPARLTAQDSTEERPTLRRGPVGH